MDASLRKGGGRVKWCQLGTSGPAGSWVWRSAARSMGRSTDVLCSWRGGVPVVTLLAWGYCNSCQWSGASSSSGGRHLPGCCWNGRIGGSCIEGKTRTGADILKEHSWCPCTPTPKTRCPQVGQGILRKLFQSVLRQKTHAWAAAQPSHTNSRTGEGCAEGAGWGHQTLHLTDVAFKCSLEFFVSQQLCK